MAVASKKIPVPDRVKIRTALLSVSDKSGIVELAQALSARAETAIRLKAIEWGGGYLRSS